MSCIEERLRDITDVFHEIHLKKICTNYWICFTHLKKWKTLYLHEVLKKLKQVDTKVPLLMNFKPLITEA